MRRYCPQSITRSIVPAGQRKARTRHAPEGKSQSLDLFFPAEFDELFRDGPFGAAQQHPEIPDENKDPSNYIRPVLHLIRTSKDLPRRMTAEQIIFVPGVKSFAKAVHLSGAHG